MRKKIRASLPPIKGSSDADTVCCKFFCDESAPSQRQTTAGVAKERPEATQPHEADIELESLFWKAMATICEVDGLSRETFIDRAKAEYPSYNAGIAVRTAVATYFFRRSQAVSGH